MDNRNSALKKLEGLLARTDRPGTPEEGTACAKIFCKILLRYGFKIIDPIAESDSPPPQNGSSSRTEPKPPWEKAQQDSFYNNVQKTESHFVFGPVHIRRETEKGLLAFLKDMRIEKWIPKSQVHPRSQVWHAGDEGTLVVTYWFAGKAGWRDQP